MLGSPTHAKEQPELLFDFNPPPGKGDGGLPIDSRSHSFRLTRLHQ
jgi:hypothetical protein